MLTYQDAPGSNKNLPFPEEPSPIDQVRSPNADAEPAALDAAGCEEMLIVDHRADLGPAQWVEHKLSLLLNGGPLPVSHARMLTQLGTRSHC